MNINDAVEHPLFEDADPKLLKRFKDYHFKNPHVFQQFRSNALAMRRHGRKKYSAWTIINKIRWDYDLRITGEVFEINNDHIALYSRLLIATDKTFEGFFELRQMKPKNRRVSWEERDRKDAAGSPEDGDED